METIPVKIKICNPVLADNGFSLPDYASQGSSGMDLRACVEKPVILEPGRVKLIPTGLAISMPPGFEAQIRPRSGLALKHGIGMVNAPGTIDQDYRGEIGIILINFGETPFVISMGDRIAQMVFSKVYRADLKLVAELDDTMRGKGGFGHSGV
ncbi:dUTP diphosphatase [delta proteobacterium NaphS2]|nr:dUTP diphosphatase [delta proteobacterium NaphS2]